MGAAISLVFIVLTLSRVDLADVGQALAQVAPAGLVGAMALAWVEVCIRAFRWQRLLLPIRPVPYTGALGLLCVGYFANSILPARLGDVARAYLAGESFGLPKMVAFGSILIERIGDGVTILLVVTLLILTLPEAQPLAAVAIPVAIIALAGAGLVSLVLVVTRRTRFATTGIGRLVRGVAGRLAPALDGIGTAARLFRFGALTLLAFGVAVALLSVVASAVGLALSPLQVALLAGGVALSTAIPAAPGSIGTYEFVGVTILTGLGFPADESLAAVLLAHLVVVLAPAMAGLVVVWHDHIRVESLVAAADRSGAVEAPPAATSTVGAAETGAVPRLAVILPAYNEAGRIEQTIMTIAAYRRAQGAGWPIVLADDGSTDDTIERAQSTASSVGLDLRVLRFGHRGKAATVRDAMLTLADDDALDYLMMLDADDELKIDQLSRVPWGADPRTIYIGRRDQGLGSTGGIARKPLRRIMSAAMSAACGTLLGLPFRDTQCGFKLYPRVLAGALFGQQRSTSWVFDAELLVIATKVSGLPVREVPVIWQPRGVSRVTGAAVISSSLGLLGVVWRYWTGGYKPVDDPRPRTNDGTPGVHLRRPIA